MVLPFSQTGFLLGFGFVLVSLSFRPLPNSGRNQHETLTKSARHRMLQGNLVRRPVPTLNGVGLHWVVAVSPGYTRGPVPQIPDPRFTRDQSERFRSRALTTPLSKRGCIAEAGSELPFGASALALMGPGTPSGRPSAVKRLRAYRTYCHLSSHFTF